MASAFIEEAVGVLEARGDVVRVSQSANIPYFQHREQYFDYFSGLTGSTVNHLESRKLPAGLQKTYLLETVSGGANSHDRLAAIMARSALRIEAVGDSDTIFRLVDKSYNALALLEAASSRYLLAYTLLPSTDADRLIKRLVASNPMLDHLWLSSQSFMVLWNYVLSVNSGRRYGRITFEHESLFDESPEDGDFEIERRASRFSMADRLSEIEAQMLPLRRTYSPLASVTHLRIPAVGGRGGHDLYYNGKATNRSDSFLGHRNTLLDVIEMYAGLTNAVEEKLWLSGESTDDGLMLDSAVAELIFDEELSEHAFKQWMLYMFNNRRNRFRISGFANWINDQKVHANAIDQHLWQPIVLELTPKRVVAVLPEGTCGNTINRLVSNVQRFVDPKVSAYIGDAEYSSLVPRIGARSVG